MGATRRTNLALHTAAILERRAPAIAVLVRAWRVELPYSHHRRKKRRFRFLSNTGFDTVAVQAALLGPICRGVKLRGLPPITIDWPDLDQGRNGLFAAVRFRGRGLPLLSWAATPEELNPSQNRVEEFFIGRLLRHLPTNIRPLLLGLLPAGIGWTTGRRQPSGGRVGSRGELGLLHLGCGYYLATPDPPHNLFAIHRHQTGYA